MIETRPREEIRVRYDAVLAETIGIRGANDDEIEAYTARLMEGGTVERAQHH